MNSMPRSVLLVFWVLPLAYCASVPVPATKAPDSPASASAAEGRFERLELFAPGEAPPPSAAAEAASSETAMPAMDHSKMDHSAPEAKPATVPSIIPAIIVDPSSETYTCVMHPQIAEPKPGKCPICGMALVKKPKERK